MRVNHGRRQECVTQRVYVAWGLCSWCCEACDGWVSMRRAWWPENARTMQKLLAMVAGVAVPLVQFYNEWVTSY